MSNAANPYAAPAARVDDVPANPEAEAIRRAHINHEASVKAVGFLFYLGGALLTIVALGSLVGASDLRDTVIAVCLLVLGASELVAGWGVRALRAWGRKLGSVLSAVGLLAFPIGTLISIYMLYLFLSKKGRTIFAPPYQDVVAATPHVKYRTSIIVWIVLALLLALVAAAVLAPMFGR